MPEVSFYYAPLSYDHTSDEPFTYMTSPICYIEDVQIQRAGYNGLAFDGVPFSDLPHWLLEAMRSGILRMISRKTDPIAWTIQCRTSHAESLLGQPKDYVVLMPDQSLRIVPETAINQYRQISPPIS